jgi:hypothetical protein
MEALALDRDALNAVRRIGLDEPRLASPLEQAAHGFKKVVRLRGVFARLSRPAAISALSIEANANAPADSTTCLKMFSRWRRVAMENAAHAAESR